MVCDLHWWVEQPIRRCCLCAVCMLSRTVGEVCKEYFMTLIHLLAKSCREDWHLIRISRETVKLAWLSRNTKNVTTYKLIIRLIKHSPQSLPELHGKTELQHSRKPLKSRESPKMAPYSSPCLIQFTGSAGGRNWVGKMTFTCFKKLRSSVATQLRWVHDLDCSSGA